MILIVIILIIMDITSGKVWLNALDFFINKEQKLKSNL